MKWQRLVISVDESEFKQQKTSLTGTMTVELIVAITMDETANYDIYWCCGCSVGDRSSVVISKGWTTT